MFASLPRRRPPPRCCDRLRSGPGREGERQVTPADGREPDQPGPHRAAEEADRRLREGELRDQGRADLAADRPGRPEDPADAAVRQGRRRARGARHHRRPVLDQRLALRHGAPTSRAGTGWEDLTDERRSRYAKDADGKTYYVPYGFYGLSACSTAPTWSSRPGSSGPPASWDELLEQATAIQDPSKNQLRLRVPRRARTPTATRSPSIEAYVADEIDRGERVQADERQDDLLGAGGASTR